MLSEVAGLGGWLVWGGVDLCEEFGNLVEDASSTISSGDEQQERSASESFIMECNSRNFDRGHIVCLLIQDCLIWRLRELAPRIERQV